MPEVPKEDAVGFVGSNGLVAEYTQKNMIVIRVFWLCGCNAVPYEDG